MRILFNISTITGGGAGRVMSCLANQFAEYGDEVGFITSYIETEKGEYYLDSRIKRFSLSDKKAGTVEKNIAWPLRIGKACREFKPDIVVSFISQANIRFLIGTPRNKFVRVVSVRVDPRREYSTKLSRFLAKTLYKKVDGVVFQTEEARSFFDEKITSHSTILPNQIDERFFNVFPDAPRKNIVSTGRLSSQKNYKLLIEAFSRVAHLTDDNLIIYGEGPLRESLEKQIAELGMTDRILLPGATDKVIEKVKNAKAYVLSSNYEGMPNGLIEALAMGVPSICTDCGGGGPRELIEDGVNGLLYPIQDADALAEKLEYALVNPNKMEQMAQVARERAESFRPEKVFMQWREYFSELVEAKKSK